MPTPSSAARRPPCAVVIGASLAGLLAARVLSDHFARVVLIERDRPPPTPRARKGVPQSQHPHLLLERGLDVLDTLFPNFAAQLTDAGAVRSGPYDWYRFGGWTRLESDGVAMHSLSHPLLEQLLRERLETLPQVAFLCGNVVAPFLDGCGTRVAGVHLEDRSSGRQETLQADAVVDAGGRGSRSPRWLEGLGFAPPRCSRVEIDLAYSSCLYHLGDKGRDRHGMVIVEEQRDARRVAGLMPVEAGRWALSLAAYHRAPAPEDHRGVLAFLHSLPQPHLYRLIRGAEPVTEVQMRKLPGSLWRHYERLRQLPENYFVIGEALCSLNPASAAGISVAAREAEALQQVLERAPQHRARSYFRRTIGILRPVWLIATGEDFAFTSTRGKRPPATALLNWYRRRTFLACAGNRRVQRRSLRVINLLAPPRSLLHPQVLLPVMTLRERAATSTGQRSNQLHH